MGKHKIVCGDCIEVMPKIPNNSIDMILCDLPYGTTACSWDTVIPFEPLWGHYKRIIKDNGAIVLTASQPFTSALVMSNIAMFKYEWIWEKTRKTGFPNANKQPLRNYEDCLVFYNRQCRYNPQDLVKKAMPKMVNRKKPKNDTVNAGENDGSLCKQYIQEYENYPSQTLKISNEGNTLHPAQKPIALFEYLIKTYTNEGDLILDNCVGSGTTLVACERLKRNGIGIDLLEKWCETSYKRLCEQIEQTELGGEQSTIQRIGF